jgi:hypothetical protein
MKCLLFCLSFFVGLSSPAQQLAEWRPSVAEDNKSATWEDTVSFLSTTLMFQAQHLPARVDISKRCRMQVVSPSSTKIGIGISFAASLDPAISKEVSFKHGVIVAIVNPVGPAASAGIRPKDVILSFDHHTVSNGDDLLARVQKKHVGDKVDVEYMRGGKTLAVSMIMRIREDVVIDEWDFTALDPLTVRAELGKASTVVHFKGSNNGPVGQQISVTRIMDRQPEADDLASLKYCSTTEGACSEAKQPLLDAESISFDDAEIGKRYSRALMHAALICGGTKAVSPF